VKRLAWSALAALFAYAASARADTPPSVWGRARDPEAALAYDLHAKVQERLVRSGNEDVDEATLSGVRDILLRAGAEKSRYPLLRFDLGFVLEALQNHGRAAQVYKSAIADFPDDPNVERAWLRLAFACGHLGDNQCERDSYLHVLRIETEDILRATPTLNLAETQMHLGDLKEAVEGYREALRIAGRVPSGDTAPLATWGLAVALDRAGDRVEAEHQARFAVELERSMGAPGLLRSKNVFFVPDYEIHWYEGLGEVARAKAAPTARDAVLFWARAEHSFSQYVEGGEKKNDRWLPIAKARLEQAKRERLRAEKAAPKEIAVPSSGADLTL
jgi:tetratricopeptide (TPR) repeat protein